MNKLKHFSADGLTLDWQKEAEDIAGRLRSILRDDLKRQGLVVGISGGIDSSTVAALCVRAVGKERVFGLMMPEKHSAGETRDLSRQLADHLGIEALLEDISPILEAVGCYRRQTEAIQQVIPEYAQDWKSKIVLPSVIDSDSYRIFSVVAQAPDGRQIKKRLTPRAYLGIVAATNFKQRIRKMLEYYHADRLNYAVAGTPNRLEYDQGFFVKLGDGAADVKPIAHLYKTQVYALARHLGLPEEICRRQPTTDTYSMSQTQEEFYFSLPYDKMDLCLYGRNHGYAPAQVAQAAGLTADQVQRVFEDIDQKRRTTGYLHRMPQLVKDVPEITV
ncbi:MAG: NAD(+) synthase [Sedimentisphaerales bacterium]|nr:NAD(+) synthase [Sedimentisphaerales bacterium]